MLILGVGGSNHDYSACLTRDNEILYMIEDERITRKKNARGLGTDIAKGFSRKYCLSEAGIELPDVDMIVSNDLIHPAILFRLDNVKMIDHHLAHSASTFFCSPFEDAAILVVDSVGSKRVYDDKITYNTVSFYYGSGNHIFEIKKIEGRNLQGTDYVENSLGIFYTLITEAIGFKELEEGKTMGLAPYGTSQFYNELSRCIYYAGNGKIEMSLQSIEHLRGYKNRINNIPAEGERNQARKDLAFSAQKILEELMTELCIYVKEQTNAKKLCLAGGVALNSVANYKIYKKKIFEQIFIQPAAGDNGTSIGSALYGYYEICGNKRCL